MRIPVKKPFVFLFVSSVILGSAFTVQAAPHIPTSGSEVIEHLPSRNDPVQKIFQRLRSALAATPGDIALSTELARRYIDEARTQGDPRYLGYAQAALAPWWSLPQPPIPVMVLRATLLQSTHQFPAALQDLNAVLRVDHDNAQAWLTRATVLQVQGQYMLAKNSCEHLYSLAPALIVTTCLAGIGSLDGEATQSYEQLSDSFKKNAQTDTGVKIWVLTSLAEISARRGDTNNAEKHYQQAMALSTPDSYLLGSYSDFLLDQKRPAEVAALLKNKKRVDALLLRYTLALKILRDPDVIEQTDALAQRFAAAAMRADTVHQREHSRFELQLHNDPKEALKIAQLDWAVQKEPADARVYLEAAIAANDRKAAMPVLLWFKQNHVEDVVLSALVARLGGAS